MPQVSPAAALVSLCLLLAACGDASEPRDPPTRVSRGDAANGADSMASRDSAASGPTSAAQRESSPHPTMQVQVVLERLGFGTGVIDGEEGLAFANALKGFQEANGLDITGTLDGATRKALAEWNHIPATRVVTIPETWRALAFTPVPDDPAAQAEMERLGYENLTEKLAERFHTTPAVLAHLNRGAGPEPDAEDAPSRAPPPAAGTEPRFAPGQQIRVPNVGADRIEPGKVDNREWLATLRSLGVGTEQPDVARIVVDESEKWLKAYDADGALVALFTVSTGSERDPLPIGDWGVNGVARNPPFAYDPELFWDVPDSDPDLQLPPGPNGPVGVVWIDLNKEHYGIHGTPAPETIGRAQSHGCVRLTNWDAARLAEMVSGATKVTFRK